MSSPSSQLPASYALLPPTSESPLLATSTTQKTAANHLFTTGAYDAALTGYLRALAPLPAYLDYEIAVLRSNIAACHVRLEQWREAMESAEGALEGLARVDGWEEEQVEDGEEESSEARETPMETLQRLGWTVDDVQRIRTKALMRRANARMQLGKWADLEGADQDYTYLSTLSTLSSQDRKTLDLARRALPAKMEAAKQNEMAEVMGKLKQLGNGILKPFGLSTNNFQFVKDEKTGGYSMGFDQNP
ncbi:hypothetical protein P152DRAFT_388118 [Eremomyces bilateralis CBS 781.70]|uniref:Tetratricopeptide repeat protein 1 n=1 Tax=Eremomyces bilateralis CBS 781.70 TaxID=1392243 RepID=A0A6G1GHJ7_9PEZI|nr:uncharacterized protein P152DRAFT_388118 [Eremomyces bilateralis CBS 781.70]KAF1817371.1 hypothetical protein P152DRAFT_388118 [Eremomyces bilateralis CBS 781.70]